MDLFAIVKRNESLGDRLNSFKLSYSTGVPIANRLDPFFDRYFDDGTLTTPEEDLDNQIRQYFKDDRTITEAEIVETFEIVKSINRLTELLTGKFQGETLLHVVLRMDQGPNVDELFGTVAKLPKCYQRAICSTKNSLGDTPLHLLCSDELYRSYIGARQFLCSNAEVDVRNKAGDTPLHLAAVQKDHRCVKELLESDADAKVPNEAGQIPLHCACRSRRPNKQIVKLLMEAYPSGVSISIQDDSGQKPLHMACANNNCTFEVLEELFQHKTPPDVNEADCRGRRPIYLLCKRDKIDCDSLLLLLRHGSNINLFNLFRTDLGSAIQVICGRKDGEAIEVLIRFYIDPGIADKRWSRPTTSVLPVHYNRELLVPFIGALSTYHMTTRDLDESGRPMLNWDGITEAAELASEIGCGEWLKRCLTDDRIMADWRFDNDEKLKKLIDISIEYGHESVMAVLVEWLPTDAWVSTLEILSGKGTTLLISKFPQLASKAFDRCVRKNANGDFELRWDLLETSQLPDTPNSDGIELHAVVSPKVSATTTSTTPLLPTTPPIDATTTSLASTPATTSIPVQSGSDQNTTVSQEPYSDPLDNDPILLMIKSDKSNKGNEERLIDHPLVRTFILSRWCIYGRLLNLLLFICLYCPFLGSLTVLSLLQNFQRLDNFNSTVSVSNATVESNFGVGQDYSQGGTMTAAAFLIIWSILNIVKETCEMWQKGKRYRSVENALEIVLYMLAFVFAMLCLIPDSQRSKNLNMWQWRFSGITVFFGWINLTLFLRKSPFGITVIAFEKVSLTFLKHFPLILIFSVAFSALFYGFLYSSPFFHYFKPLLKVAVLIVGDYPTLDHIMGLDDIEDTKLNDLDSGFGALIFIIFICVMAVVMMNMLVGIAVDEIAKVLKDSEINSMAMKAEWIVEVRRFQQRGPKPLRRLLTWYINKCYGDPSRNPKIYTIVDKNDQNRFTRWLNSGLKMAEDRVKLIYESSLTTTVLQDTTQSGLSATKQLVMSLPLEINNHIEATVAAMEEKFQQQLQRLQDRLEQQQQSLLQQILERLPKKEDPKGILSTVSTEI